MGQSNQMTDEYRAKLNQGLHYQDKVVEALYDAGIPIISYSSKEFQNIYGENKAGFEIKNDTKYKKTGNFYIETAEKSNKNNKHFVSSGIYRNDNTWLWIQGDTESFVFSKKQLVLLHKSKKFKEVETLTSKGFLLPVDVAIKYYVLQRIKIKNE